MKKDKFFNKSQSYGRVLKFRRNSWINVFFENNIFKKNHWPKEVLIQPINNIYYPGAVKVDDIIEGFNFFEKEIEINYLETDSKGLWQGF